MTMNIHTQTSAPNAAAATSVSPLDLSGSSKTKFSKTKTLITLVEMETQLIRLKSLAGVGIDVSCHGEVYSAEYAGAIGSMFDAEMIETEAHFEVAHSIETLGRWFEPSSWNFIMNNPDVWDEDY